MTINKMGQYSNILVGRMGLWLWCHSANLFLNFSAQEGLPAAIERLLEGLILGLFYMES
jgi:hypothetical protein